MTLHEQIVTVKVQWDDGGEVCDDENECCGEGQCDNRYQFSPNKLVVQTNPCCNDTDVTVEVLQKSPVRERLTEVDFS